MKKMVKGLVLSALLGSLAACGGGGGGSTSSEADAITIAGTLGGLSLHEVQAKSKLGQYAVSASDLEIYVVAFSNPPAIAQADVGSDGSFSVTLEGVSSAPITAIFRDKTSLDTVGQVVFNDPAVTDINGEVKDLSTVSLKGNVTLGNITLGDDGKVTIPISQVAANNDTSTSVSTSAAFDFSGTWTAAAYSSKPTGYITAGQNEDGTTCSAQDIQNGDCMMPVGEKITLIRLVGKEFTPGAGCDDNGCTSSEGTIGTADKYGISIWGGPVTGAGSAIAACGSKTGFTADDARLGGKIHLASNPVVDGTTVTIGAYDFTYPNLAHNSTPGAEANTNNVGDSQPWMKTGATASYDVFDCANITQGNPAKNLSVCKGVGTKVENGTETPNEAVYMVGVMGEGSGCVNTATGKPVMVSDWSHMPDNNSCTHTDDASFPGLHTSSCTYTNKDPDGAGSQTAMNYTCTHTGGMFTTFNGTAVSNPLGNNVWMKDVQNDAIISQGASCSVAYGAGDAKKMAVYRCFAQALHGGGGGNCDARYSFNWAATTPANFLMDNGHSKPKQNFITDILTYSSDGNSFFVDNFEHETVAVSQNGMMNYCEIERNIKVTGVKASSTSMVVSVVQTGRVQNFENAACVAASNSQDNMNGADIYYMVHGAKMMFTLNK
ncbi:hypothetical protein ACES2L_14355 [Bdellovibrio bacteriovorus]